MGWVDVKGGKSVEKKGKLANCLLTLRESCVLTEPSPPTNCSTKDRSLDSPEPRQKQQRLPSQQALPAYRGDLCMSVQACTYTQAHLTRRHSKQPLLGPQRT